VKTLLPALLLGTCLSAFALPLDDARLQASGAYQAGHFDDAFSIMMPFANKGDAEAENFIGSLYARGEGVTRDIHKAIYWYEKAASQGHPLAMNNLGGIYLLGGDIPVDRDQALYWYGKAANAGDAEACIQLAQMLMDTQGQEANVFHWMKTGAERGHPVAQHNMGHFLEKGIHTAPDPVAAWVWYRLAAQQGSETSARAASSLSSRLSPRQKQQARTIEMQQREPTQ
jgi:TPR repeat protein